MARRLSCRIMILVMACVTLCGGCENIIKDGVTTGVSQGIAEVITAAFLTIIEQQ